jgi:hypothetical protein
MILGPAPRPVAPSAVQSKQSNFRHMFAKSVIITLSVDSKGLSRFISPVELVSSLASNVRSMAQSVMITLSGHQIGRVATMRSKHVERGARTHGCVAQRII